MLINQYPSLIYRSLCRRNAVGTSYNTFSLDIDGTRATAPRAGHSLDFALAEDHGSGFAVGFTKEGRCALYGAFTGALADKCSRARLGRTAVFLAVVRHGGKNVCGRGGKVVVDGGVGKLKRKVG